MFGLSTESRTWRKLTGDSVRADSDESTVEDIDKELGITRK